MEPDLARECQEVGVCEAVTRAELGMCQRVGQKGEAMSDELTPLIRDENGSFLLS